MRRAILAPFLVVSLAAAVTLPRFGAVPVSAQVNAPAPVPSAGTPLNAPAPAYTPPPPPVPIPQGPASAAPSESASPAPGMIGTPVPGTPAPAATSTAQGELAPATPAAGETPASGESANPGAATPAPTPTPTPPPIIVEPPNGGVEPGKTITLHVNAAVGTIAATVADPTVVIVAIDQNARTLSVYGKALGTTFITVTDERGQSRDVGIRVAYNAGSVADTANIRITGDPATAEYVKDEAVNAAIAAATTRPGASATASTDEVTFNHTLDTDRKVTIDVPIIIEGTGYFTVAATTHVTVENYALPRISPSILLVSDYPETLHASGELFTADLDQHHPQRFLYYHYEPKTEPARRIVLKAQNTSGAPALVQLISGAAGPEANEMEVGHLSTQRFLVRSLQNEGRVMTIPPNQTVNLLDVPLPPGDTVSGILQLRLVNGFPLKLSLVAQDQNAPVDTPSAQTQLLSGGAAHARGVYPVPEFFFDYTYPVDGPNLAIPIGQLPLPNLRQGEALSGDYGVEQSISVRIINNSGTSAPVAIYANPRGGQATGTFLIDRTLVQAHRLAPYSRWKIWQSQIAPHTFRTVQIVTMPEGGSSYPLRLEFGPDDGSASPGAPGSPIY